MAIQMGYFAIAVSLTVLDWVVTVHYRILLRIARSGDVLSRGLVVLLAAFGVMSQAYDWAQVISKSWLHPAIQSAARDPSAAAVPVELRGERNV